MNGQRPRSYSRNDRLTSLIQAEIPQIIRKLMKDPDFPEVTVTRTELTVDGKKARFFVAPLGAGVLENHDDSFEGIVELMNRRAPKVRWHLGKALHVKFVPEVVFMNDTGLENSFIVNDLLKRIHDEKSKRGPADQ